MFKKLLLVIALLMAASPALAWNFNFLGSDDHQRKHRTKIVTPIEQPEKNPPVSVPEPATVLLLSGGIVALAAWRKR